MDAASLWARSCRTVPVLELQPYKSLAANSVLELQSYKSLATEHLDSMCISNHALVQQRQRLRERE